jgi:hypothetical protein
MPKPCLGELWINYSLLPNSRGKLPSAFTPGQVGVWLTPGLNETNNYHKPFLEEHWAGRTHVLGAGYLTDHKTLGMLLCLLVLVTWEVRASPCSWVRDPAKIILTSKFSQDREAPSCAHAGVGVASGCTARIFWLTFEDPWSDVCQEIFGSGTFFLSGLIR